MSPLAGKLLLVAVAPMERLVGRLDATTMQRLNAAVDLNKQPLEQVVRNWRRSAGLEGVT